MTSEKNSKTSSKMHCIVDIDLSLNKKGISNELFTPRTMKAVQKLGLTLDELEPVNKNEVKDYYKKREKTQNPSEEFINLRYKMLDQRRYDKQKLIIEERTRMIDGVDCRSDGNSPSRVIGYPSPN
jgi:hypothetical protein